MIIHSLLRPVKHVVAAVGAMLPPMKTSGERKTARSSPMVQQDYFTQVSLESGDSERVAVLRRDQSDRRFEQRGNFREALRVARRNQEPRSLFAERTAHMSESLKDDTLFGRVGAGGNNQRSPVSEAKSFAKFAG